jgi:hypothetical protein
MTRKPTRIGPIDRLDKTHFEVVVEDRGPGFERLSTVSIEAIWTCIGPMTEARMSFVARVARCLTSPDGNGCFETERTNVGVPGTFDRLDLAIEAALPFCLIPEAPKEPAPMPVTSKKIPMYIGPLLPSDGAFMAHVYDCDGTKWRKSRIRIWPVVAPDGALLWQGNAKCWDGDGEHFTKAPWTSPHLKELRRAPDEVLDAVLPACRVPPPPLPREDKMFFAVAATIKDGKLLDWRISTSETRRRAFENVLGEQPPPDGAEFRSALVDSREEAESWLSQWPGHPDLDQLPPNYLAPSAAGGDKES